MHRRVDRTRTRQESNRTSTAKELEGEWLVGLSRKDCSEDQIYRSVLKHAEMGGRPGKAEKEGKETRLTIEARCRIVASVRVERFE